MLDRRTPSVQHCLHSKARRFKASALSWAATALPVFSGPSAFNGRTSVMQFQHTVADKKVRDATWTCKLLTGMRYCSTYVRKFSHAFSQDWLKPLRLHDFLRDNEAAVCSSQLVQPRLRMEIRVPSQEQRGRQHRSASVQRQTGHS
eukprot:3310592-Amphidinium_carterae.1